MDKVMTAEEILKSIQFEIVDWHKKFSPPNVEHEIVTEEMKNVKTHGLPNFTMSETVKKLILAHCEMWHEEDKVHGDNDELILSAVRNNNFLNIYRSALIEQSEEKFKCR